MKLKYYRNRYGSFGLVPEDSPIVGSAVDVAGARTEEVARQICDAVNCHEELVAACTGALFALGECSVGNEKLSNLFPMKVAALRNALDNAKVKGEA